MLHTKSIGMGLLALGMYPAAGAGPPEIALPHIRTLRVWRAWADARPHAKAKWLVSQSWFYPNGEQQRSFWLDGITGDTLGWTRSVLNKDSTLHQDFDYNKYLKRWQQTALYLYRPGQKRPYAADTQFGYHRRYTYDAQGRKVSTVLLNEHQEPFNEDVTSYDAGGLVAQTSEFRFFGGHRTDEIRKVYEYVKDDQGRVRQKESCYVPTSGPEPTVEVDGQDTQKITYHGSATMERTRIETIYYNQKGEQTSRVEYGPDDKPEFIWTYEYDYYR